MTKKIKELIMGTLYIDNETKDILESELIEKVYKLNEIVNDPKNYGTNQINQSDENIKILLKEYLEKKYPLSNFKHFHLEYCSYKNNIIVYILFPSFILSNDKQNFKQFILNNKDLVKELFTEIESENCEILTIKLKEANDRIKVLEECLEMAKRKLFEIIKNY